MMTQFINAPAALGANRNREDGGKKRARRDEKGSDSHVARENVTRNLRWFASETAVLGRCLINLRLLRYLQQEPNEPDARPRLGG